MRRNNRNFSNILSNVTSPFAMIGVGIAVFIILLLLFMSFFTVSSGTRKIVFTAGEATSVAQEGLNFKIPFYQSTKEVNIKTLQVVQDARAASRDLQIVQSTISVNYHYDSDKLLTIYKSTGFDIAERIIAPRIQETLKAVAAKYSAESLIAERGIAKSNIDTILKSDLLRYNIIVEDVQLTEFDFSPEFNKAIEEKQTEAQKTLKADNILQRTIIEAKQRVAQAEGEATAITIQAKAIQNEGGAEYVSLKWIEKWNGELPDTVAGGESGIMLNIKK